MRQKGEGCGEVFMMIGEVWRFRLSNASSCSLRAVLYAVQVERFIGPTIGPHGY